MKKIILALFLFSFVFGTLVYAEEENSICRPCSYNFQEATDAVNRKINSNKHPCNKTLEKLMKDFEKEKKEAQKTGRALCRGVKSLLAASGGALSHGIYISGKSKSYRKEACKVLTGYEKERHNYFMDKIADCPDIDNSFTKITFVNLLTGYRLVRDELDKQYNKQFKVLAKEIKKKNRQTVTLEDLNSLTLYMDPTKNTEIDVKIDRLDIDVNSKNLLKQFTKNYYQERNRLFKVCVCQEKANTCLLPSRALMSDPYKNINLHK